VWDAGLDWETRIILMEIVDDFIIIRALVVIQSLQE
jgi:hypothetical protein